jgi:hypothetical protein
MQAFGLTINKFTAPLIYLACSIVGFLFMRESIIIFHEPIAARAISMILELGFIILALPAIYYLKAINVSKVAVLLTMIWLTSTLISTLLGDQPWAAMARWLELLSSLMTAFCLYVLISNRPELIPILIKAIMAALLLCIIALAVFWHLLPDPTHNNWVNDIPLFSNIRHLGYVPAAALPLGYWLLETKNLENKSKHTALIYLILCWALVFWLGGRGTFLGVITATVLYCILSKQHIKWVVSSIILGLVLSQLFIVDHPSLNLFRILDLFLNTDERKLDAISSNRMTIYVDSLVYWWNTAPFFGIGADGFRYIIPSIGGVDNIAHPHSVIIQLLMSYGPIGLLIPTYFFLALSWKILHIENRQNKTLYLALVSTLVLSIFDGVFYHAYGLFITTIITGISISLVWPKEAKGAYSKEPSNKNIMLLAWLIPAVLLCLAYYTLFIYQLYYSKSSCIDEEWINWNAEYPAYFSPTLAYPRYSFDDIEKVKAEFIKNKQDECR